MRTVHRPHFIDMRRTRQRLSHFTQRPTKVDTLRRLIIESDVTVGNRPSLNSSGFQYRFAQEGCRHTVKTFMCRKPNQVPIPFDKNVFASATKPRVPFVHLSVAGWYKPGNFLGVGWVRNVINPQTSTEVRQRHEIGSHFAGCEPRLNAVRTEAPPRLAKI